MESKRESSVDGNDDGLELVTFHLEDENEQKVQRPEEVKHPASAHKFFAKTGKPVWTVWEGNNVQPYEELNPTTDEGGFEIFGMTRAEGISALSQYVEEDKPGSERHKRIRRLAAPEIEQALFREGKDHKVVNAYEKAQENLALKMTACRAVAFPEDKDQKKSLSEILVCLHNADKLDEYKSLLNAKRAEIKAAAELHAHCESPEGFKDYIHRYCANREYRLKPYYDKNGRPITSVIDAMAQHTLRELYVFGFATEDSKTEPALPLHEFKPVAEAAKGGQLKVLKRKVVNPGFPLGEKIEGYFVLDQLDENHEARQFKYIAESPNASSYKLSLDAEKEQWCAWYFHECVHAVLESKTRPEYINFLKVFLGPNIALQSAIHDRDKRHAAYEIMRSDITENLYVLVLNVVQRQLRELYQHQVFDAYEKYCDETTRKETQEHEQKIQECETELKRLEQERNDNQALKALADTIKAHEEKAKKLDDAKPRNQQLIDLLNALIREEKQQLAAMGQLYPERQAELNLSRQHAADALEQCRKKWLHEKDMFDRVKTSMQAVLPEFCMHHVSATDTWTVSVEYQTAIERHIFRQAAYDGNPPPSPAPRRARNEVNPVPIAQDAAREMTTRILQKFTFYERQFNMEMEHVAAATSKELQDRVVEVIDRESEAWIMSAIKQMDPSLGGNVEKVKAELDAHIRKHLGEQRSQLEKSTEWHALSAGGDLRAWINTFRKKVLLLKEASSGAHNRVIDDVDQYHVEHQKMIAEFKVQAEAHLKTMRDEDFSFLGKDTRAEAHAAMIELGVRMGKYLQIHFTEPKTGDTLLHVVNRQLQVERVSPYYRRRLFEAMITLFYSGSAIQVKNAKGEEACKFEALAFEDTMAWRVMTAFLHCAQTVSEFSDDVRSELCAYANDNDSLTTGTRIVDCLRRWFTNTEFRRGRVPYVQRLIQALSLSAQLLNDGELVNILKGIAEVKEWKQTYSSKLKTIALTSRDKVANKTVGVFGEIVQRVAEPEHKEVKSAGGAAVPLLASPQTSSLFKRRTGWKAVENNGHVNGLHDGPP